MPWWNTYFLSSFQSLSVLIVTCLVVLSSCTGFVILFVFLSFFSSSFYFLLLTNLVHLMLSFCFSVALCAARAARTPRPSFLFSFALVRHLANRTSSSLFLPFSSFLLYFLFCFPWLFFYSFSLSSLQSAFTFKCARNSSWTQMSTFLTHLSFSTFRSFLCFTSLLQIKNSQFPIRI